MPLSWTLLLRSFLVTIGCTATIRRLTGLQADYFRSDDFRLLFRAPRLQKTPVLRSRLLSASLLPALRFQRMPPLWRHPLLPPLSLLPLLPWILYLQLLSLVPLSTSA